MIANLESVSCFLQILAFKEFYINEVVLLRQHASDALKAFNQYCDKLLSCEIIKICGTSI